MDEEKEVNEAAKELSKLGASKGGIARAKKLTPEERSEIARMAVETRWEKAGKNMSEEILKATHENELKIGGLILPCAVLRGGVRVLTSKGFLTALGRPWKGTYKRTALPTFIGAKNLVPFISSELEAVLTPLKYKNLTGQLTSGYKAELLPLVCEVYLQARDNNALTENQKPIAKQAEILTRGLSRVGIIALIDEVTGYQEIRDRIALQKILDKYLTDEWAKWTKTFPDDYYKELFRLKNVPYPPIPSSTKKPSYVGHWTNDIIYERLAPGVKEALKELNPRLPSGFRGRKHHQHLTRDYGHPELTDLLSNVIFLMKTCTDWNDFKNRLDKAKPQYGHSLLLDY